MTIPAIPLDQVTDLKAGDRFVLIHYDSSHPGFMRFPWRAYLYTMTEDGYPPDRLSWSDNDVASTHWGIRHAARRMARAASTGRPPKIIPVLSRPRKESDSYA